MVLEMIEELSDKIAAWLVENTDKGKDEFEIYSYGISVMISYIISLISIFTIGLIFNSIIETAIYAFVFTFIRKFTGGYHCNTYLRCNLLYISCYVLSLATVKLLSYINFAWVVLLIAYLVSNIIIIRFSPIAHKNKPIAMEDFLPLKLKAVAVSVTFTILSTVLVIMGVKQAYIVAVVLLQVAVAMLVAIHQNKKGELKGEGYN